MKGRKGSTDEGGVRSVCFIRWPGGGIGGGRVICQIAGAIDLLPTLASLTGLARVGDKPLDGRDLSPLLLGARPPDWPDRLIFSHQNGNVSVRSQQHRLDNSGALFDMAADSGQQRNIADSHPDVVARLADAVREWRKDVLKAGAPPPAAAKAKAKAAGLPPDDRPYPVGYAEFPMTPLPARDGIPHGGVRRSAAAPNCSYFVNWKSPDDFMTWDIEVNTAGDYQAVIHYTCPLADAGSVVELRFKDARLTGKAALGWDPPLYTNQDTLPRPAGESRMKEFRPLDLGTLRLEKGRGLLTLRALEIPGQSVMDVRMITLTLKK